MAGAALNVSGKTVDMAAKVHRDAVPGVAQTGSISVRFRRRN